MIILNLPLPPSVNTYWRANGNRRFISKEGMEFKRRVAEIVIENNTPKLGAQPVEMWVYIYPRDRRRQDIDNRLKAVLDSIQDAGVIDDDSQVDRLIVERGEIRKGGGCMVFIFTEEESKWQ